MSAKEVPCLRPIDTVEEKKNNKKYIIFYYQFMKIHLIVAVFHQLKNFMMQPKKLIIRLLMLM